MIAVSDFSQPLKVGSLVKVRATGEQGYVVSSAVDLTDGVPNMVLIVTYHLLGAQLDESDILEENKFYADELELLEDVSEKTIVQLSKLLSSGYPDDKGLGWDTATLQDHIA